MTRHLSPESPLAPRTRRRCGYCGAPLAPGKRVCDAHGDLPMKDPHDSVYWRSLSSGAFATLTAGTQKPPDVESPDGNHVPS
jgi:hypothetical protein